MCGLTRIKDERQGTQSVPCSRLAATDITWWRSKNVRMRSRYLNPGEVICVSVKKVKSVFKDYNATLYFAAFTKRYSPDPIRYTIGKKFDGTIICNAGMQGVSPFSEDEEIKHLSVRKVEQNRILRSLKRGIAIKIQT